MQGNRLSTSTPVVAIILCRAEMGSFLEWAARRKLVLDCGRNMEVVPSFIYLEGLGTEARQIDIQRST